MALIDCPECGRQVSEKAPMCLGCGFPINKSEVEAFFAELRRGDRQITWLFFGVIFALLVIAAYFATGG